MTYRAMMPANKIALSCLCLFLASCGTFDAVDKLLGAESRKEKLLEGERVAVLDFKSRLSIDPALEDADIGLGPEARNRNFASQMAVQQAGIDNLELSGFELAETARAGDSEGWELDLTPAPVVGDGTLFAIDSQGILSAHDAEDISSVRWAVETSLLDDDDEATPGGGLAYDGGVIYATTGSGTIIALVAADGSLLWRHETGVPVRAAPVASGGQVYAITIENQLLAFNARTGRLNWSHRGIREASVYLGSAAPVVENDIVIAAYSSGELFALAAEDGRPLWSDSLVASKRTSASAVLTGISATPLIHRNAVYAASDNGLAVASLLTSGRGLWDLELSSFHRIWRGGNYLFVIEGGTQLMAVRALDARIKWSRPLFSEDDLEDDPEDRPSFTAPIIANGKLMVLRSDGYMLWFDPNSGELLEETDAPDDVHSHPIIADGRLYLLDKDAVLYQYE